MRIAIIGGTGFIGSHLTDTLLAAGHNIRLLVRPGNERKAHQSGRVHRVAGDLASESALQDLLHDCDALVYSVGILREEPHKGITFESIQYEGATSAIDAAVAAGVPRLVLMSANGAKTPGTKYQETKFRAEQYALQAGIQASIFRPSVVFGNPHGRTEIATQLFEDMIRPLRPAINFYTGMNPASGSVVMSPVHVKDLSDAIASDLENKQATDRTFTIGGPEVLSWKTMISRVAISTGRKKWFVPMPVSLMYLAAAILDWLPAFPVTRDQLKMLAEGNTAAPDDLYALIDRPARQFNSETLQYLRTLANRA